MITVHTPVTTVLAVVILLVKLPSTLSVAPASKYVDPASTVTVALPINEIIGTIISAIISLT
jgi:hypothetical protein